MRKGRGGWMGLGWALALCVAAYGQDGAAEPENNAEAAPAADTAAADAAPIAHIVVTANAIPTDARQVGSSITVVTAEDIERKQARTLLDALKDVPGLQFASSGGPGSATSLFMRGANSGRTAIMVDGQPVANPWDGDRAFDINALFNLDNVERIEVLRGPQSMLYGSDAMAGVVNVITRKGAGAPTATAMAEAGSRGTLISRLSTAAGSDKFDYSFGAALYRTDGVSQYDKGSERDHYDNESLSLRLGANPTDALRLDLFARYRNSSLDMDGYNPDFTDTDGLSEGESYTIRPQATLSLLDDRWTQTLGYAYGHYEFTSDDRLGAAGMDSVSKGYSSRFDYRTAFKLTPWNTLAAGVDHTREWYLEKGDSYGAPVHNRPDATELTGVFLQDDMNFGDRLFITLGVRNDHHNTFGDRTTYRGTVAYRFPTGTKLSASYGTGFKAPSLYQLYAPWWGNADLNPETNKGWDIGFEQELFDARVAFGATYFDLKYKDMLTFGPAWTFENVDRARTRGVETFARWRITDTLDLSATYTYLDAKNETTGFRLGRRARHTGTAGVHWRFLERGDLDVRYRAEDWRYDNNAGGGRLGGFGVVDVAAAWKVNDRFTLTARAENLFDKTFRYAKGYRTTPRSFFGGFNVQF